MKDIFKLTFQDKKFKVKMVLYVLLIMVVEAVAFIVPIMLMNTWSTFLNVLGVILLLVMTLVVIVFSYMIIINKLLAVYYPNMNVGAKDLIFKGLALLTIIYPATLVMYFGFIILFLIAVVGSSWFVSTLTFVAGVIFIYQVVALATALAYIVLDLIENNVLGYKCVFVGLIGKLKKTRKYSGQIVIRVIAYMIITGFVLAAIGFVLLLIITGVGVATGSVGFYIFLLVIFYIGAFILSMLVYTNSYHFMIIRYKNVKKLLNS